MEEVEKPAEEVKAETVKPNTGADNTKLIAAVGYVPFVCILPLLSRETDAYLAFHGRQGLLLTIASVIVGILSPFIAMAVPLFGMLVIWALDLVLLAYMVMGGWKAYNGEKWVLPYIGQFADKLKF